MCRKLDFKRDGINCWYAFLQAGQRQRPTEPHHIIYIATTGHHMVPKATIESKPCLRPFVWWGAPNMFLQAKDARRRHLGEKPPNGQARESPNFVACVSILDATGSSEDPVEVVEEEDSTPPQRTENASAVENRAVPSHRDTAMPICLCYLQGAVESCTCFWCRDGLKELPSICC